MKHYTKMTARELVTFLETEPYKEAPSYPIVCRRWLAANPEEVVSPQEPEPNPFCPFCDGLAEYTFAETYGTTGTVCAMHRKVLDQPDHEPLPKELQDILDNELVRKG